MPHHGTRVRPTSAVLSPCDAPHMAPTISLEQLLRSIASSDETSATSLAVLDLRVGAGEVTPIHAHDQDEALHVLEGELVVHRADGSRRLRPGETFTAPAREPHAVAAGAGGARYLTATYTMSVERYADFQRAVARPGPDGGFEGADVVRALGEAAGIEVLGFGRSLPALA